MRIGDVLDHAGTAADIAIYRAPDPGTTGALPVAQIIARLHAHNIFGVETGNLSEISVTRRARVLSREEIETAIIKALEPHSAGMSRENFMLAFDRPPGTITLDASYAGALEASTIHFNARTRRFDITFTISSNASSSAARLRFTGNAFQTEEVATLTRDVARGDILRASDIAVERKPRRSSDASPSRLVQLAGMQARNPMRTGHILRAADVTEPDLVRRGEHVTLIYQSAGLSLSIRGKALDNGTAGSTVTVINLQTKREMTGMVIGANEVMAAPFTSHRARLAGASPTSTAQ